MFGEPLTSRRRTRLVWLGVLLLFSLALALRSYRLSGQSFWNDEGTSVALAARDLLTITRDASHDIHPPFYYYLLHIWIRLFGNSEVAVRSLSALLGGLAVVLTYLIGRRLFDPLAAWAAAVCALLSPLQVYYAQEARMYILVTALGGLSFLLFLRWLPLLLPLSPGESREQRQGLPWAYAGASVLMIYSHYFAFALLAAQNLLVLIRLFWWWRKGRSPGDEGGLDAVWSSVRGWILAQVGILSAFLPWLFLVWRQIRNWPAVSESLGVAMLLKRMFYAFNWGLSDDPRPWLAVALLLTLAAGWTAWWTYRGRHAALSKSRWAAVVAWAYWLVPVAVMYLLSLRRPLYNPKFLLLATPGYALVLGRAIAPPWLQGRMPILRWAWIVVTLGVVVFVSAGSLTNYFSDPRYARDDYRGMAQYIEAIEEPNDAILINAPGQYETFVYYYQGALPIYPLPRQRPIDVAVTKADLIEMIADRRYVYAIFWATDESDPERYIESWLDSHTYKASDNWYGNVRLVVYAVPQGRSASEPARSVDARFGDDILLQTYTLLTPKVHSGEVLQLRLTWEALSIMEARYKVFIHVLGAEGHIFGQRDAEPGGGAKITTTWTLGETVEDNHGVFILPGTPPGTYRLVLGLYDIVTGNRLPITGEVTRLDGNRLLLGQVRVQAPAVPPPVTALDIAHPLDLEAGPVRLLGYNLHRLGQKRTATESLHPGDILHLTWFWQATGYTEAEAVWSVQWWDAAGEVRFTPPARPLGGAYPVSQWESDDIIREPVNWFLPANLSSGTYRLVVSLGTTSGEVWLPWQVVGTVLVE